MSRPIQQRDRAGWRKDMEGVARVAQAAQLEDERSQTWRFTVERAALALLALIDPDHDEETALREFSRHLRLLDVHGGIHPTRPARTRAQKKGEEHHDG